MKPIIKTVFTFIATLTLIAGCSSEEEKIPSESTVEFEENGQSFKIVPLYEEFLDYTNEAKEDPSKNNKGEFYSRVIQPFLDSASEEEVSLSGGLDYSFYFYPTRKVQVLQENTIELLKHQDEINNAIKESLIKSANKLPGKNKTIFVRPVDPQDTIIKHMNGVAAITLSKDAIVIMLDPSFNKEMLEYTVAHEYHHSVFFEDKENEFSLLNGIIFEGKAESFASQIYPNIKAPWSEPLAVEEEKVVLEELKNNLESRSMDIYNQFFDGDFKKDIPMWSSYKIGLKITDSYLNNNPEDPIKEWTMMDGKEIVRGSDYSELIKD
jgi:uncharacterized protein YjaZ